MIRILGRSLLVLLLLVFVAAAGFYLWLRSSLPVTDGRLGVPGLIQPVVITRDAHGIPTIKAQNDRDAAFALGFLHAQDRLFQMDLMRRYGAGRLSEWFGAQALAADRSMRTLSLYRAAEAQYALLTPQLRAVYDAYAAGVNAFVATRPGALPPEYAVLRVGFERWTPIDSLVWGKEMDLELSANYRQQLLRYRLAQQLKPEEMAVLFPGYPSDAPVVLSALGKLPDILPGLPPPMPASNEWVVDGKHSASGKPILANDPHLGFATPGIWYLARIETPDDTLAGVTSPGEPMIVLGHNTHIAWGFTTTGGDVEDLFIEKADPNDPSRYLTPDGTQAFTTRTEEIKVRGAAPVRFTVRSTRHGPVIANAGEGEVLALSATWLLEPDRTPQALWDATHAHDWDHFHNALRNAVAPEQNITYADTAGNIGFTAPALIPIRKQGDASVPEPGWTGDYDWTGFIPFDDLPTAYDPPSGRFVAANNKIVPNSYPYFITHDWELPYRAERIGELLDKTPLQTPATTAAIQGDVDSLMARQLLPLMLTAMPQSAAGKAALQIVKSWDQQMSRDQAAPLIFIAWLREFNRQIFADRLGSLFPSYWALHPDVIANILQNHHDWCDDPKTPSAESCETQLGVALDRTTQELSAAYGSDMSDWRWGAAHPALFKHPLWSRLPFISGWFRVAIPDQGSFDTIDNATMIVADPSEPFAAIHGPSMRMIIDMANPAAARFMTAPGESGNLLSRHYRDLLEPWRNVESLVFSDDSSGGRLNLAPR